MEHTQPDDTFEQQDDEPKSTRRRSSRRRLFGLAATGLAGASLAGVAAVRLTVARSDDEDDNDQDGGGDHDTSGHGGGGEDADSGRGRGRGRGRGGRDDEADAEAAAANAQVPAGSAVVEIFNDDGFTPPTLTIDAGQTVTFVNLDGDDHTATGSAFDTGIIPEGGGSASVVLDTPGRYPFACLIHPEMVGELLVRDEAGNVPERAAAAPPPADAVTVQIINLAFSPASVSVPVGTTVAWTNDDSLPHTATALDGSFDSGILDAGGTFSGIARGIARGDTGGWDARSRRNCRRRQRRDRRPGLRAVDNHRGGGDRGGLDQPRPASAHDDGGRFLVRGA
jgi:plastocyanin